MQAINPTRPVSPALIGWKPGDIIKHFTQEYPVDVAGIAEALGIKVWEDDLPGLSGVIEPDKLRGGSSGYSIVVNASDPYGRKRFTIAHEIAHYLLHRNRDTKQFKDDRMYRSGISSQLESDANRLAADILMPRRLIRQLLDSGITDPEQMAEALQVSNRAIRLRLGLAQMAQRQIHQEYRA